MAKKKSNNTPRPVLVKTPEVKTVAPVKAPIVAKEIKPSIPKPIIIYSGSEMVKFYSFGLSRYMNKAGKIHTVTGEMAQVLINKGYGKVID